MRINLLLLLSVLWIGMPDLAYGNKTAGSKTFNEPKEIELGHLLGHER